MDIIKSCQSYFSFQLPSRPTVSSKRVAKFNMKFKSPESAMSDDLTIFEKVVSANGLVSVFR